MVPGKDGCRINGTWGAPSPQEEAINPPLRGGGTTQWWERIWQFVCAENLLFSLLYSAPLLSRLRRATFPKGEGHRFVQVNTFPLGEGGPPRSGGGRGNVGAIIDHPPDMEKGT